MIFQTVLRMNVTDRYAAHVEIDQIYKTRSRVDRKWHHAIVDTEVAGYWALLKTNDMELVQASPNPKAWALSEEVKAGDEIEFLIQYAPKKACHFSAFYEKDDFAIEHIHSRLIQFLDDPEVLLMHRQRVDICKRQNNYHAPSAFFGVRAKVKDAAEYEQFLITGIGGSRSFGLGLAIAPDTPLHQLTLATVQGVETT